MHLRDGIQTHLSVAQRHAHLVEQGGLRDDPAQRSVVAALDRLNDEIHDRRLARKSSALGWLFAKKRAAREQIKGLYIHGGVGRGKTMLMDMFFDVVPVRRKRRVHFNAFMTDAHDRIQKYRQARKDGLVKQDDPMPAVARELAEEAWVLCFDEFSVTDIADAMILSRLFSALFANGVVLVATSNVAPDDLYLDGLNRGLFEPFIGLLKQHAEIVSLDSPVDYRLEMLNRMPVYITPSGSRAKEQMDRIWKVATAGHAEAPVELTVKGRTITAPRAAHGAARFSFAELCETPMAAREYLAIAARFTALFIDDVPVLDPTRRSAAKRFILLIDTLYDQKVRLVVSAARPPHELYAGRPGIEQFEFQRTISRLMEMQGHGWLEAWGEKHGPSAQKTGDPLPVEE